VGSESLITEENLEIVNLPPRSVDYLQCLKILHNKCLPGRTLSLQILWGVRRVGGNFLEGQVCPL